MKEKGGKKEDLCETIIRLLNRMQKNVQIMKQSRSEIELNRNQTKQAEEQVIKVQRELIDCQKNHIERFEKVIDDRLQATLKSEMKNYSDVLKKSVTSDKVTISGIKSAVKDVMNSTVNAADRDRSVIIFGLQECDDNKLTKNVETLLLNIDQKPRLDKVIRFGKEVVGKCRPARVTFNTSESVHEVLKVSKNLKCTDEYSRVYICMDRTPEQREKQKKLVEEMKKNIDQFPNKRFYIKGGKVVSEEWSDKDSGKAEASSAGTEISVTQVEPDPDKTPTKVSRTASVRAPRAVKRGGRVPQRGGRVSFSDDSVPGSITSETD